MLLIDIKKATQEVKGFHKMASKNVFNTSAVTGRSA